MQHTYTQLGTYRKIKEKSYTLTTKIYNASMLKARQVPEVT